MNERSEVTLTVHGLDVDNGNVRAEVFLSKFRALVDSLKIADKHVNKKKAHDYVIVGLKVGSAQARLREKIAIKKVVPVSSVQLVKDAAVSVYNGERNVDRFPRRVIDDFAHLVQGVGKKFSHGEIKFDSANIIRIDDYLVKQVDRARRRLKGELPDADRFFEGISLGTFDGVLKELDARGVLLRGKLVLTAGGKEIDCVFNHEDIPTVRQSFDQRARIEAVAHYDGESQLPVRLDVKRIRLVDERADLLKWKGALTRQSSSQ